MLPRITSPVFQTPAGVRYLKAPGVAMIMAPHTELAGISDFLGGFAEELGFTGYLKDPTPLDDAETLVKFAGQLCYTSLGDRRTRNEKAPDYFHNIKSSGHGSVLQHAQFSFLLYGISRSLTHELVRHVAGTAYSQVSQRYVDATVVRFVERPEYQADPELHALFEARIEARASEYADLTDRLFAKQAAGDQTLSGEKKTELRKKVQQCARSCLPNETEAPMVFSANVRALRHIIEMRAAQPAEIEIRRMAYMMYSCVRKKAPLLFSDYAEVPLPDGVSGLATEYRKV